MNKKIIELDNDWNVQNEIAQKVIQLSGINIF